MKDDSDDKKLRSKSYPVGYRKTPPETRYKKGQSGNPAGRPKGYLSKKTLRQFIADVFLHELVTLKDQNGQVKRTLPKLHAILFEVSNRAVKGDHRAAKLLFQVVDKYLFDEEPDNKSESAEEDEAILQRHGVSRSASPAVPDNQGQDSKGNDLDEEEDEQ